MALNISNQTVENKAVHVSKMTGVNKTAAVEMALDYFIKHHESGQNNPAARQDVNRLLDELASLPVLDQRDADEILGYDEHGLS